MTKTNNSNTTKGSLMLLTTAIIWGLAFIAQRKGMDHLGEFTFSSVRCILAGICLLPVMKLMRSKENVAVKKDENPKDVIWGGFFCGLALFLGMAFQQLGISRTSIANSGFISALYIIIVPIIGLFFHKKVSSNIWIGVALSIVGLALMCFEGSIKMQSGDIIMIVSALFYSCHIMVIDHFASKVDGLKMSCIQFFVAGILNGICMFIFETPTISNILQAWVPILYVAFLSTAMGYTFQIFAQKYVSSTIASLILSLESVFAALFGWLILHETMSFQKFCGCALVFSAVILAQLPTGKLFKKKIKE